MKKVIKKSYLVAAVLLATIVSCNSDDDTSATPINIENLEVTIDENPTNGQIIGTAFDLDNNKLYWSVNGTFKNSGNPASGSTGTGSAYNLQAGETYFPMLIGNIGGGSNPAGGNVNFGNGFFGTTAITTNSGNGYAGAEGKSKFNYAVPSGYSALSTKGLNQ